MAPLLVVDAPSLLFRAFHALPDSIVDARKRPVNALLGTAAEVMRRRGCELTPAHAELYRMLFAESADERRRVVREMEMRALRRSA